MKNNDIFSFNDEIARVLLNLGILIKDGTIKCPIHCLELVAIFPQTWGDTSCGFGGMAGQAMTTAFTVVFFCPKSDSFLVFIAGQFAYSVKTNNEKFKKDLSQMSVKGKTSKGYYLKEEG